MQSPANLVARDLRAVTNSPSVRTLLGLCLFEVAYYFAYRYGMSFGKDTASPFWFPDSVLLCALLLSTPGRWWIFILAALPIRLFVGVPPDVPQWFLLATSAIDFVKGLLGATILRRLIKNPVRLETVWDFAVFCLFAVLLIPFASAFGGAALRHRLGYAFWPAWEQWFMGDALTQLIVTPAIFYLVIGYPWAMPAPTTKRAVEGGLLTAGLILTGYIAFNTSLGGGGFAEPRFYAPVPFLFWAAIRFGMFGASGAITIITVLSVAAALHDRGPFSGQSPAGTALALQQFLLLRAAPLYLVAILIEQKRRDEYALHELREDDMRSHRALHESEERVALAAEAANLGVWELNLATNRLWVSDEWRSLFQLGPDEPVSYDEFRTRVHPEDRARWEAAFERAIEENSGYEIEYRVVLPNGTVRWISGRARCLPNAFGLPPRLLGVSADVSQRKQAEEEARRQREQINLLSRVSLLGEMTASLAHELNQPLSAIISNANAGTRFIDGGREDPATLREILISVVEDGHRAHDIIQNVRNTVKKGDSTRHRINLNELVTNLAHAVRPDAVGHSCEVETSLAEDLPLVEGDPVQIQQVLVNLVSNAFDAMRQAPPDQRKVEISTAGNGDGEVRLSVRDHGTGLAAEVQEHLFDQFFTTKEQGLGMGLAIVRSIVEAHGGKIDAENAVDGGARFYFSLPVAKKS